MGTSWQLQEDTRGVKSTQQILTLFADVSQRRNDYIEIVSLSRGVPQPTSWGEYTREQWRLWLRENSFDEKDMEGIVSTWKHEFELNDFRETAKVEQWREEGTRDSKKKLVTDLYGARDRQLALAFLKCPPAMMDTLLRQWREYMESSQYTQERDRERPDRL